MNKNKTLKFVDYLVKQAAYNMGAGLVGHTRHVTSNAEIRVQMGYGVGAQYYINNVEFTGSQFCAALSLLESDGTQAFNG